MQRQAKDIGLIFQDEVSQEIIVDMKSGGDMAEHAFSDLEGRLKPGTREYQALLHVIEQEISADKNIEIPSLSELRKKYDEAFARLAMVTEAPPPNATVAAEPAAHKSSERVPASSELQFSIVPDAGYTNPSLKGYRLIPLETGAMLVSESGDKRVFGFQGIKVGDDQFEVSLGATVSEGSLLALRRKESIWLIHLSRSAKEERLKIDWSKRLEFPTSDEAGQALKVTVDGEAISVESGQLVKRVASASGRLLVDVESTDVAQPSVPVKPENREPAAASESSSVVHPIED